MGDVREIARHERDDVQRLLEQARDAPSFFVETVRFARPTELLLGAWRGTTIVGTLMGSTTSNWHGNRQFREFRLPRTPHACIEALYVDARARREGVGRQLIVAFAHYAASQGCAFVGGTMDLKGDVDGRRAFFTKAGFTLDRSDHFGTDTRHLF